MSGCLEQYHVRAEIESRDRFDEEAISEDVTDTELLDDRATTTDAAGETAGQDDEIRDNDDDGDCWTTATYRTRI